MPDLCRGLQANRTGFELGAFRPLYLAAALA